MDKALDETSTLLTPQIVKGKGNILFHSEWDNLNKILTNVHGHNVVNSAGGIMVQEVATGHELTKERTLPTSARIRRKNFTADTPMSLPALHIYNRTGPTMPGGSTFTPQTYNDEQWEKAMKEYSLWVLCRKDTRQKEHNWLLPSYKRAYNRIQHSS